MEKSSNPWGTTAEIQAHQPTYEIDTGLFMEALATIVDVAKGNYTIGEPDEEGNKQLIYKGVEYEVDEDNYVFDQDGEVEGKWNGKTIERVYSIGPIDEDEMRKLTYGGVEYEVDEDDYVFDEDGEVVGKWNGKSINFADGQLKLHQERMG